MEEAIGKTFAGTTGTHSYEYELMELKTYTYWSPSKTSAFYYQGLLRDKDKPDVGVEVSILCFGSHADQAKMVGEIFRYSNNLQHDRVLKAYFSGWNNYIKKNVVCFERFEGFFGEEPAKGQFLELKRQGSTGMRMHPHPQVQLEIIELTTAINKMHMAGVSNSCLEMSCSYFWCKGKLKTFATYSRGEMSDSQWINSVKNDLYRFRDFMDKDLLLPKDPNWKKKEWFLKCFRSINHRYPLNKENNLDLITLHPFLMRDKKDYVENFSRIRHAVVTGEYGTLHLKYLKAALDGYDIDALILNKGTGEWTRPKMHPVLIEMIEESQQRITGNERIKGGEGYKKFRAYGLLNLLRDTYEHGHEKGIKGITLDEIFNEVSEHWPLFNGQLHEYIYGDWSLKFK